MKGILTLVAACLLPSVIAYGERGIAERMLYYIAYLCEEQTKLLDPSYEYKVAPGCGSGGKRCSMDEFLVHIWAEKTGADPPDTEEPKGMSVSTGIDGKPAKSFNEFEGAVNAARFDTGATVDGNVKTDKLWPGAADYYDALSKMGGPMDAFSKAVIAQKTADPKFKVGNRIKLWQLGKDCTAYVTALRRKNMDKFRAEWLREHLNTPDGVHGGFQPEWTNIDTAKTSGNGHSAMSIPAIDFDKTIDTYKSTVPNIEDLLKTQNDAFFAHEKNGELINKNHLTAVEAGRAAMFGCNCATAVPRELKKRSLINKPTWLLNPEAVHYGGPKAAKSRKLKIERLASMGVHLKQ